MIKVGQKVEFDPLRGISFYGLAPLREVKQGTVVYVNEKHRWFTVEYDDGRRTSYLFHDLGDTVRII